MNTKHHYQAQRQTKNELSLLFFSSKKDSEKYEFVKSSYFYDKRGRPIEKERESTRGNIFVNTI